MIQPLKVSQRFHSSSHFEKQWNYCILTRKKFDNHIINNLWFALETTEISTLNDSINRARNISKSFVRITTTLYEISRVSSHSTISKCTISLRFWCRKGRHFLIEDAPTHWTHLKNLCSGTQWSQDLWKNQNIESKKKR